LRLNRGGADAGEGEYVRADDVVGDAGRMLVCESDSGGVREGLRWRIGVSRGG
jgi:hypothetical protein